MKETFFLWTKNDLNRTQPANHPALVLEGFELRFLHNVLEADNWQEWLLAMTSLAGELGERSLYLLFSQVIVDDLLALQQSLEQKDFIELMKGLLFYKMKPQLLYDHGMHPEKIMSVQARLTVLYGFIKEMHQAVFHTLHQRGIATDYHGLYFDEIGAKAARFRDVFVVVMKLWPYKRVLSSQRNSPLFPVSQGKPNEILERLFQELEGS
jgi:hypothetical protein